MNEDVSTVLKVRGLSLSYGRVRAVDGLDLTVREGEVYGFLGRNGAGKTSVIRSIMGIVRPDQGAIELMGRTTSRTDVKQKQQIGYVSQEQHFYPWMSCRAIGRFVSGFYPTWDHAEFDRLLKVDFDSDRLLTWLLRDLLLTATNNRAAVESKMWVLDGFATYWSQRKRIKAADSLGPPLALRAAYGRQVGFHPDQSRQWLKFREQVGEPIAAAVAWSGLRTIITRRGDEECQRFVQTILGSDVPADARAVWYDLWNPPDKRFEQTTGFSRDSFHSAWLADLDASCVELRNELKVMPTIRGTVSFQPLSETTRKVVFQLDPSSGWDGKRYQFWHAKLPVFDAEVPANEVHREDLDYSANKNGELPETYARGDRLFHTFAVQVPALDCHVVSGWTRQEIR